MSPPQLTSDLIGWHPVSPWFSPLSVSVSFEILGSSVTWLDRQTVAQNDKLGRFRFNDSLWRKTIQLSDSIYRLGPSIELYHLEKFGQTCPNSIKPNQTLCPAQCFLRNVFYALCTCDSLSWPLFLGLGFFVMTFYARILFEAPLMAQWCPFVKILCE